MGDDLPDFTRYVSVNVNVDPDVSYVPTISEGVAKSFKEWQTGTAGTVAQITPASGKGVYLLIVVGNTETDGDSYTVEYLKNSVWTKFIDTLTLWENGHFIFAYPSFYFPDQDAGDGSTVTVRVTCAGTGDFSGHIVYYEDDPPSS